MTATTPAPRPSRSRLLGQTLAGNRLVVVVGLSFAAGLLVAGLAVPVVGLVGVTAKATANSFLHMPTNLAVPPLPQASKVYDARGQLVAALRGDEDRELVPLSRVPMVLRQAVIDIEDTRFYEHHGIDYKGLLRAYVTNQESGDVAQGGSTLTQQYVKNVLEESATTMEAKKAATERTVGRKLREARYALALEQRLPKDKILENYLNIAYFGDGAYGVQTAARHYFDVDVSQVNAQQAAMLAGLVRSPSAYNPLQHPKAATKRRNLVLDRMHGLGHLDDPTWLAAQAAPLGLRPPKSAQDSCELSAAPFFCAYVRQRLLDDPRFGATRSDRARMLYEGGLTIRTSLDPVAQANAQNAATTVVPPGNRVAAALSMVQPGTGNVLAMATDRSYGPSADGKPADLTTDFIHSKLPLPTDPDSFSPGSAFKVFTLTSAIDHGIPLSTTLNAPPCYESKIYVNPDNSCPENPGGNGFRNAEAGEGGVFSLTTATWNSVNTYFIQLEEKVGVENVGEMARRLGVTSCRVQPYEPTAACKGIADGEGSVTLGSHEASTLDMATAYATLAARGLRCYPRPIESITAHGRPVPFSAPEPCKQVIRPKVADTVSSVLEGVINNGTAKANGPIGRPAAGKTGTAENHSDAWFVGYVPQLATAVMLGDPRGTTKYPLAVSRFTPEGVPIPGWGEGSPMFGGDLPTRVWAQTMRDTLTAENIPVAALPAPDNTQPTGPKAGPPKTRGRPAVPAPAPGGQPIAGPPGRVAR